MALAVIAPWTVRNLATFDRPVPISVNGEEVLATANCDLTWHGAFLGYWHFSCYQGHPPGDESDRAAHFADQGLTYIGHHLGRAPVVALARMGRIWDVYRPLQNTQLNTIEGRDRGVSEAGLAAYAVLMPLAIAGAVVLRRRGRLRSSSSPGWRRWSRWCRSTPMARPDSACPPRSRSCSWPAWPSTACWPVVGAIGRERGARRPPSMTNARAIPLAQIRPAHPRQTRA